MREAAIRANVSETTWRHTEAGSEPKGELRFAYRAGDATLARMARACGVTPDQLRSAGRGDAAANLEEIMRRERAQDVADDRPQIVRGNWDNDAVREIWGLRNIPPAAKAALVSGYLTRRAEEAG